MKKHKTLKTGLILVCNLVAFSTVAQNTFPTNGNVGVGTTSPNAQIHLKEGAAVAAKVKIQNGNSVNGGLIVGLTTNNSGMIRLRENQSLKFYTNNTEHLRIASDGLIGIGTTTPTAKLHLNGGFRLVDGTQQAGYFLGTDANGNATWQALPSLNLWSEVGGNLFYDSGNVNIGAGASTSKLAVGGTVESTSGGFKFPDGTVQTSAYAASPLPGTFTNPYSHLYVNDFLKVGTNSLWLTTGAGSSNEIWTSNGALIINPVGASASGGGPSPTSAGENTLINPDAGNVGIGTLSPIAKLHLDLDLTTDQYGMEISYPIYPQGTTIINDELFKIAGGGSTNLLVKRNGVGINTNILPASVQLHVKDGFVLLDGGNAGLLFDKNSSSAYGNYGIDYEVFGNNSGLNFWRPSGSNGGAANHVMFISDEGEVGIGVNPATEMDLDYKLYVAEGILTEKVKVSLRNTSDWADYVFEEDYNLLSLEEVENYIDEHKHLPDVPSAEEVVASGINVAEMDALLLQKIEELTLYMIELKKENEALKSKVDALQD